ncbi:MAG: helix-turn-helix domain-containing protein [candidate division Zixibacteria bacterium]|jgi:transposase|nr:helix-turn-helix domain-containing protein [candidate division Zixibacteria bacterium]
MARPEIGVDPETVVLAEEELAKIEGGKLCIQLKAIIAAREHRVKDVAAIMQVSVRSIFRWITQFKTKGVEEIGS